MCAVAVSPGSGEPALPRLTLTQAPRTRPSVVVVASNPLLCRFVRLALETDGYAVSEAGALGPATGLVHFAKPALIVVDQEFGGDDWQQVCRELHRGPTGEWRRILLLTNGPEHAVTAVIRGLADTTVDKPCTARRLRRHVRDEVGPLPGLRMLS